MQMTTDTAVRVTQTIVQQKGQHFSIHRSRSIADISRVPVLLSDIKFIDHPELRLDQHESTVMPFRYMADEESMPIMPEVSCSVLLHGLCMKMTSDCGEH